MTMHALTQASETWEHITKMCWTVLPHPDYSLDLVPSDFHLFGSLKDALRELSLKMTTA
jgi:hypothetical protein